MTRRLSGFFYFQGKRMSKNGNAKDKGVTGENNAQNPVGRPTDYKSEYVEQVYKLALLGLTDVQMSDVFDVSEQTFNTWKHKHPEFLESLKRGKILADAQVAESLYKRANGYSHKAVKIMQYEGSPIEVDYTEHYPPDTAAATIWLKNRQPLIWRDKQDHEITGKDGKELLPSDPLDIARRVAFLLMQAKIEMDEGNG